MARHSAERLTGQNRQFSFEGGQTTATSKLVVDICWCDGRPEADRITVILDTSHGPIVLDIPVPGIRSRSMGRKEVYLPETIRVLDLLRNALSSA